MSVVEINNASTAAQPDQHLIAGRYRLHERIGSGRLGDIFSAIDEDYEALGVEQHVAIQVVSDIVALNNTLFNKLKAGYETLRAAAHPHIVDYRHFGRDGKVVYLGMELLEGASLRQVLGETEALPLDEVLPVVRSVGGALLRLHADDLVHGNLTAGNVFITDGLEVQLLDVVPLNLANAIFRGATIDSTSGPATVEDDVFGLACLTYQMLTGRHPFNHGTPAKASAAGLEPDRIASLGDREWSALHRALALDAEQRTTSVADFLRDFGVKGTERLRPSAEHPVEKEAAPAPEPVANVPNHLPPQPAAPVAPPPPIVASRSDAEPVRKKPSLRRSVLLLALLASLAAWYSYGEPEENFVELIGFVDASFDLGLTAPGEEVVLPVILPAATTPKVVDESGAMAGSEPVPSQAIEQPEPIAIPAEEVATNTVPDPVTPEPEPIFAKPFVSVSERDASARVTLRRTGGSDQALLWWTSEHTARADTDFIPVPRAAANSVASDVLLIPLVNDNLPELDESFFVNVGFRRTPRGAVEQVATIRVDIVDDDLR